MKKIISISLMVVLLWMSIPVISVSALELTDGDYTYKVNNGEATITSVNKGIRGSITIPATLGGYPVISIGNSAFANCYGLAEIYIPNGVTSIGVKAFDSCANTTKIDVPDSVRVIGDDAFNSCNKVEEIHMPNGVTSIGNRLFYSCSSLTKIDIPDSVTSIGDRAFFGCDSLTEIDIPDSVVSIGDNAFFGCDSLTEIHIPDSVTSFGKMAFSSCSSLMAITVNDTHPNFSVIAGVLFNKEQTELLQYPEAKSGSYTIPNGVIKIGTYAFYYCESLTEINIPDSVTSIGEKAFCYCDSLTKIHIPNSVKSIGDQAFAECSNLKECYISTGVTSIGEKAFYSCSSLTKIDMPDSVTFIGDKAFEHCSSLTKIDIPTGVTFIGNYLFCSCSSLKEVHIPNRVKSIRNYAFYDCNNLTKINIPDSVTSIASYAFFYCSSLTKIDIPDSVTLIGPYAFYGCIKLTKIHIPDSAETISISSFRSCSSLTTFSVNKTNPLFSTISGVLFNKKQTRLLLYPEGKSGNYTIPRGVTDIGDGAFYGYTGSRISIPVTVKKIGSYAFKCYNLKDIYYSGNESQCIRLFYRAIFQDGNDALWSANIHCNTTGQPTVDVTKKFRDVKKGAWYTKAVSFAYNIGWFEGTTATTFEPNGQMTRGMFVTVLGRLAGASVNNNTATKFKDVASGKWYTGYVKWAADKGIVNGTSTTTFAPDDNVTREQICKMMVEYCEYEDIILKEKNPASAFKDAKDISKWAKDYVTACQRAGLVQGSNGKFNPKGNATRAEVAQILTNFSTSY